MKPNHLRPNHLSTARGAAGRALSSLATALLVLAGAGWLSAFEEGGGPTSNHGAFSAGGGGGDDETVGTLPSHDGRDLLDLSRFRRIRSPSVWIQGPVDEVMSSALAARGDRRAFVQPMPDGELRLVFPGAIEVAFDRTLVQETNLRFGIAVPSHATVLRDMASWNGQELPWEYVYELPISQFGAAGLLDASPIVAGVQSTAGRARVSISATGTLIVLNQRH